MKLTMVPVLLVLVGAGCDELPDGDYRGEALLTIEGTVDALPPPVVAPRVALVWSVPVPDLNDPQQWRRRAVAEDVAVAAEFPARFSLEVFAPPADELVFDGRAAWFEATRDETGQRNLPDGLQVANAMVFVYDDGDRDGRLALVAPGATTTADRALAAAFAEVVYVPPGQPVALPAGSPLRIGFNLVDIDLARASDDFLAPLIAVTGPVEMVPYDRSMDPRVADGWLCQVAPDASFETVRHQGRWSEREPGLDVRRATCVDATHVTVQVRRYRFVDATVCSDFTVETHRYELTVEGEPPPPDWPCR